VVLNPNVLPSTKVFRDYINGLEQECF
jgi:hypothetical protein